MGSIKSRVGALEKVLLPKDDLESYLSSLSDADLDAFIGVCRARCQGDNTPTRFDAAFRMKVSDRYSDMSDAELERLLADQKRMLASWPGRANAKA